MEDLLIAARAVHFASTIALAGIFAFLCLVAGPAFRLAATNPATAIRLRRNFAWLSWACLLLALVSGAAWLAATSSSMSGEPLMDALSQGVWMTVLTATRFGHVWLLRTALAMGLACCLVAQFWQRNWASGAAAWAALAFAAPLLATLAWAGHGAATPGAPGDLHLAADILHLLAAAVWLGTLVPLALLLAEARRIGGAGWTAVGRVATRRFSATAVASVAVLFAAGLVNTWFLAGTVPALLGTEYGHLLLAKIAIFLAMVLIAAVNLFRLTPRLAGRSGITVGTTLGQLRRNAFIEAGCGLAVLIVVAVLGISPPGLHTEPGWPLPFRIDTAELSGRAAISLAMLALLFGICLVTGVIRAAAGRYRRAITPLVGLVLCLAAAWLPLRPAIEPAYPTSYYAPAEPYAAPSVARGQALYAENCALCHGAGGRGNGPAATGLTIRPADLTAPHLFAHPQGDLFWWISHGRPNGAMPGFAEIMSPDRRWDVINFIRARAAGLLSRQVGPMVAAGTAYPVPDFAFESDGRQQTLNALIERGPVLLILYASPAPAEGLAWLAAARRQLAAAGLAVVAVDLGKPPAKPAEDETAPPFAAEVAADVAASLRLFAPTAGTGPSALLLDRSANVRARWTEGGPGGLPDPATLAAAAASVARFPAAAPSHTAGHVH
jgi:putative copper export protein/mono/diheme cytochrome c family protein